jgi:hypothetical protein
MGLSALGLAATVAWAGPTATTADDGTVVIVGVVSASEADVRAVLGDTAVGLRSLFPEVLSVKVAADGPCEDVHRETKGLVRPLRLHVRRCPIEGGWREDLVPEEGSEFDAYTSEWRVSPAATGARVEYRVRLSVGLPVPDALVQQGVRSSAEGALARLLARFPGAPDGR